MGTITSILDLPKNAEHSWVLDLPKDTSSPGVLDLPKDTSSPGFLDLPKDTSYLWLLDLPQEIVNEIISFVPLIDLFRVSKVSHLFQSLAYKRRTNIYNEFQYEEAAKKGDILSLLNCPLLYWHYGLHSACEGGYMEMVQFMISKTRSHLAIELREVGKQNTENHWNSGLYGACSGGHMDIVQLMIKCGANDWNSGFYNACSEGHIEIVHLMINHGANNWNEGFSATCEGKRYLFGTAKFSLDNHRNIIQLMIQKGATKCNCGKSISAH